MTKASKVNDRVGFKGNGVPVRRGDPGQFSYSLTLPIKMRVVPGWW